MTYNPYGLFYLEIFNKLFIMYTEIQKYSCFKKKNTKIVSW